MVLAYNQPPGLGARVTATFHVEDRRSLRMLGTASGNA